MRALLHIAVVAAVTIGAASASAQVSVIQQAPEVAPPLVAQAAIAAHVPSSLAAPPGALDPIDSSSVDVPLVVTGASLFVAAYLVGTLTLGLTARRYDGREWVDVGFGSFAPVPFLHWAIGFQTGEFGLALAAGLSASLVEISAIIMLVVGLVRTCHSLASGRSALIDSPLTVRF